MLPEPSDDIDSTDTATVEAPENTQAQVPEKIEEGFAGLADALTEAVPGIEKLPHTQSTNPKGEKIVVVKEVSPRDESGKFKSNALSGKTEKTAEENAASDQTKTEPKETSPRDSDLETEIDPHVRPKTRKIIDSIKAQAIAARNERDAKAAEAAAAAKERDELANKLKTQVAPKEIQEELETLRTRVRELDISKDPAIEAKYDANIRKNSTAAIGILAENGIFMKKGKTDTDPMVEMSESEKKSLTAQLERDGTGIRGMAKYISALEKAGEFESAERLRAFAQHNDRLAADKAEEIGKWSKDYEGLKATRSQAEQSQREAYTKSVQQHGEKTLQADLAELQKQLPFLSRPAEILPTDSPEIKAAKQKAIGEYDAAIASLTEGAKSFNTEGLTPDKAAVVTGKMTAAAIQSLILKGHVLPRLLKEAAAKDARIKELEESQAKTRKATTINRAHSAALNAPDNGKKVPSQSLSLEDAMKEVMAENGVTV